MKSFSLKKQPLFFQKRQTFSKKHWTFPKKHLSVSGENNGCLNWKNEMCIKVKLKQR